MYKGELITAIAEQTSGLRKDQIGTVVETALAAIQDELIQGGRVMLMGFGTFATAKRSARPGRHPGTGEPIKIPAATVVKFSPGQAFKAAVNQPKRRKAKKIKP
jgi:DNA-binding protein HU-beta